MFIRDRVLTTGFARLGGIHLHEVLVGVTKQVDGVILETSQRQIAHRVKNLDQFLISLRDRRPPNGDC